VRRRVVWALSHTVVASRAQLPRGFGTFHAIHRGVTLQPKSILMVEHDRSVRTSVAFALRERGIQVREADDHDALLGELAGTGMDVALVDLHLRHVQVLPLITQLRTWYPKMPIVVTATASNPVRWAQAQAAGAQALMIKPFTVSALVAVMSCAMADHVS
jgi:DNA-binding response OmpR family regulator